LAVVLACTGCRVHFDELVASDANVTVDAPIPVCGTTGSDSPAWPMPNDPGSGLPNTAAFTSTATTHRDLITNLVWQADPPANAMSWTAARDYCATLTLDGACWRLPHRIELVSFVDYGIALPATQFNTTPQARFWTATPGPTGTGWTVDFTAGHTEKRDLAEQHRVRCMQVSADSPSPRFTLLDSETARDEATGLLWQRNVDPSSYNFAGAMGYCAALPGGGWRSPSIRELQSIVDTAQTNILVDPVAFPNTPIATFWSQTILATDFAQGWTVDFSQGFAFRAQSTLLRIRCVHD
jgi:hypothetical protein